MKIVRSASAPKMPQNRTRCWYFSGIDIDENSSDQTKTLSTLSDFSITEEAYDPNLNPIRARVSLSLQVLSYDDLQSTHQGHALFLSHHQNKEEMAKQGSVSSLDGVVGASLGDLLGGSL